MIRQKALCLPFALLGIFLAIQVSLANSDAAAQLQNLQCGQLSPLNHPSGPSLDWSNATIVMIGSSSTAGVGADKPETAYPARTADHLHRFFDRSSVTVHALGVGAEQAEAAIARFEPAITQYRPDILVWQVGTNDALGKVDLASLQKTLAKGLAITRKHALPLVLIDPQFFPTIRDDKHYTDSVDLIERFATTHHLAMIHRYKRMRGALDHHDNLMRALLAGDQFHMSTLGHECLALDLAATLYQTFKPIRQTAVCRSCGVPAKGQVK